MTTRQAVCDEARRWLRTPYHHAARLHGVGVDCAMLPLEVYSGVGAIPGADPEHYPRDWHLHRSEERYLEWVDKFAFRIGEKPQGTQDVIGKPPGLGDFVIWRWGRTFSHGAIHVGDGMVIHAVLGLGVTQDDMWQHQELRTRAALFYSVWED